MQPFMCPLSNKIVEFCTHVQSKILPFYTYLSDVIEIVSLKHPQFLRRGMTRSTLHVDKEVSSDMTATVGRDVRRTVNSAPVLRVPPRARKWLACGRFYSSADTSAASLLSVGPIAEKTKPCPPSAACQRRDDM